MDKIFKNLSQRKASLALGLSRTTLRKAIQMDESIKLSTLRHVAEYCQRSLAILVYPQNHQPESTTSAISFMIERDGFDSWKIHLMNLVDEFRKWKDPRIFILPPSVTCSEKIKALIAATITELCREGQMTPPDWAKKNPPLEKPWFVAGMESLKASALIESPVSFREKNIFVHENFLSRT